MRNAIILLFAFAACTGADQQASDLTDTGSTGATPLMVSDISGSWTGTTMVVGSDSVVGRWTTTQVTDSTSIVVFEGSPDTVRSRVMFDADSMIVVSEPYTAVALPGSPQVRFRSIGRLRDGRLVGTSTLMLAANQDSVIRRSRWEASRGPQ